jgi:hypothetical protein
MDCPLLDRGQTAVAMTAPEKSADCSAHERDEDHTRSQGGLRAGRVRERRALFARFPSALVAPDHEAVKHPLHATIVEFYRELGAV